VTSHNRPDPYDVRRSSNVEDVGHLAEKHRAEQAGSDHAEPSPVYDTEVFQLMDAGVGGDEVFEHREMAASLGRLQPEPDLDLTDADHISGICRIRGLSPRMLRAGSRLSEHAFQALGWLDVNVRSNSASRGGRV